MALSQVLYSLAAVAILSSEGKAAKNKGCLDFCSGRMNPRSTD